MDEQAREVAADAGTRVSVLADRARMTKQSMTELVAHLERHGYAERVPDPADGRELGREVHALARDAMLEVQERLDARLGAERMATLRRLLEEVGEELAPRVPATE